MAKHICAEPGVDCPFEEQIRIAYEKVVTGNGELPLPERVRKLEESMTEAMPILREVNEFFVLERNRKERNARGWQWFRWIVATMIAAGLLYVGLMEWHRVSTITKSKPPNAIQPKPVSQTYDARMNHTQDAISKSPF